eukprot:TRINITY_DN81655_c0_g1_i1.p2 TRINITY_DN81655_c0_g1~~TRINITY_DN81655_c0_g1_i1.p2  ORF type:complete len:104 (+),score=9.94 TRINITY_DN81655_c0_g1_i1:141-452(+)
MRIVKGGISKKTYVFASYVACVAKPFPTTQCQFGPYFPSNHCLMCREMSFSFSYLPMAVAACCLASRRISEFSSVSDASLFFSGMVHVDAGGGPPQTPALVKR